MNIIMTDKQRFYVSSSYAETPEYFQMAVKQSKVLIICSEPLPQETDWQAIPNNSFQVF
jgi:predicted glutamine amidotransferase